MKYQGNIGVRSDIPVETSPGIHEITISDVLVTGDLFPNRTSWQNHGQSSANLNMVLSVLPPGLPVKWSNVVYAVVDGTKWSVVGYQHERPRIKLTLGGPYNE